MPCNIAIKGIRFSDSGRTALRDIRSIADLAAKLKLISAAGHLLPLFTASSGPESLYTVYSSDWALLARAIQSVDKIARKKIEEIVDLQAILRSGKEKLFWRTLSHCLRRLNV